MNYFELYITDYQSKTPHLTLQGHGAYTQMLMAFYHSEKPLPVNRAILYRLVRANTRHERAAVEAVLHEFWIETDQGFTNKKAAEVLDRYKRWVSQQKANGSLGGRPPITQRKPKGSVIETQAKPNGGYRARASYSDSDQNLDLHTHSDSDSDGPPQGGRPGVGVDYRKFDPEKPIYRTADEIEAEERARGIVPEA